MEKGSEGEINIKGKKENDVRDSRKNKISNSRK